MKTRFEINFDMKNINAYIDDNEMLLTKNISEMTEEEKLFALKNSIVRKFVRGYVSKEEVEKLVTINSSEEKTEKKFEVDMEVEGSFSFVVEAYDEDDAEIKANDIAYDEYTSLSEYDNYEFNITSVYTDEDE